MIRYPTTDQLTVSSRPSSHRLLSLLPPGLDLVNGLSWRRGGKHADAEVFLEEIVKGRTFRILKTYDSRFAHEAFGELSGEALEPSAASLDLKSKFDDSDTPASEDVNYADFLWEE